MDITITDKMRVINKHTGPHPSLDALGYMRSLVSHEHLKMTRSAVKSLNDEQAMALPHLMVLSNPESEPFVRFLSARWLHLNDLAQPAAVAAFIELAFDEDKEIAFEALGLLEASGDQQAHATLQALVKWGRTEEIRQKATEILSDPPEDDDDFYGTESQEVPPIAKVATVEPEPNLAFPVTPTTSNVQAVTLNEPEPQQNLALPVTPTTSNVQAVTLSEPNLAPPVTPAKPFTITMPHPIIWHEPVLSNLPAVGAFIRRLPYNYEKPHRFPLLILALTTIAELLTLLPDPRFGMLAHFSTLLILFYNVVVAKHKKLRRLHTALLLIPLVRLVSLGLPLSSLPQMSWYFVASVPLFAAMAVIVRQEEWNREELGFTLGSLPLQLVMALVGLGLGWLEYQILKPLPLTAELTWQAIWLPALILLVSTGYLEELLFRGLLQSAAIPIMGRWPALIFVAALFAVLHIGYASILDVLFVFTVGLSFGLFVLDTRSLLGVTLAHGMTNISLFLLWPWWSS